MVVVPGEAFGTNEHIRLSYAVSGDVVDEGVEADAGSTLRRWANG